MKQLWIECLTCDNKCCNHELAKLLFVTDDEFENINKRNPEGAESLKNGEAPCKFFEENGLCEIQDIKPVDCKLFPFDIMKDGNKFFWIIRKIECAIVENEENYEDYLLDLEKNIIPYFYPHIERYSMYKWEDTIKICDYKVLREVKFDK